MENIEILLINALAELQELKKERQEKYDLLDRQIKTALDIVQLKIKNGG